MKMTFLVMLIMALTFHAKAEVLKLHVDAKKLAHGIILKENPKKNINLVGDKHLQNKAYGYFQIRAPYLADVNNFFGKKGIQKKWGKNKLTMQDMKDPRKAEWVFRAYLGYWGRNYTRKTGKLPTLEVYARIHNGGPHGWRNWKTRRYGKAIVQYALTYKARRGKNSTQKT